MRRRRSAQPSAPPCTHSRSVHARFVHLCLCVCVSVCVCVCVCLSVSVCLSVCLFTCVAHRTESKRHEDAASHLLNVVNDRGDDNRAVEMNSLKQRLQPPNVALAVAMSRNMKMATTHLVEPRTITHSHTLTLTHSLTHSLTLTHSLSLSHTLTLTHPLTHSHSFTHSLTLSRPLQHRTCLET